MDAIISCPPKTVQTFFSDAARKRMVHYRNQFDRAGFVHISAEDTQSICGSIDPVSLFDAANLVQPDPYDDSGLRKRCFRTATYQPHSGSLHFDDLHYDKNGSAYVPYLQSSSANSETGGKARKFAPLPSGLETDHATLQLTRMVFEIIPSDLIDRRRKQEAGFHMIKLWSDGRQRALPSPRHLHTDGELFTAVILLDRVNVAPGSATNYIAERRCREKQPQDCECDDDILAKITLETPLEMVIFDDARVSHHVSGVHGADCRPGWRTSLLIDFSPLHPERTC